MKKCPFCQKKNQDDNAVICSSCGKNMNEDYNPSSTIPKTSSTEKKLWTIIAMLIVIIALGALAAVVIIKNIKPQQPATIVEGTKGETPVDDEHDASDINIDLDHDGYYDLNIDMNNDGVADINIDTDLDGVADENIAVNSDGTLVKKIDPSNSTNIYIDTNGDGRADRIYMVVSDIVEQNVTHGEEISVEVEEAPKAEEEIAGEEAPKAEEEIAIEEPFEANVEIAVEEVS